MVKILSELKLYTNLSTNYKDFLTTDGEAARDVVVEIERATRKKPFIGGYRHKMSGIEFHHASAQTLKKQPAPSTIPKFCRDTQTCEQKHRVQQTTNDMSTQMSKIGVFVSNVPDKMMTPGKYTTADDHLNMILQKVLLQLNINVQYNFIMNLCFSVCDRNINLMLSVQGESDLGVGGVYFHAIMSFI